MKMENGHKFTVKEIRNGKKEVVDSIIITDDRDKSQLLADMVSYYDDPQYNRMWDSDKRGVRISNSDGDGYYIYYRQCGVVTQD